MISWWKRWSRRGYRNTNAEKTAAVKAIGEKARTLETTAEKAAASNVNKEPKTPAAIEVERVINDTVEEENVPLIDDEFCSNDVYSQENPSHTLSSCAPPSAYRKLGFDDWILRYNDSEWRTGIVPVFLLVIFSLEHANLLFSDTFMYLT